VHRVTSANHQLLSLRGQNMSTLTSIISIHMIVKGERLNEDKFLGMTISFVMLLVQL